MSGDPKQLAAQYSVLSNDMRFYADQRFKIVTVFLATSGVFANVAKDHASVALGVAGMALSYFCFCWEQATTRWWGTLLRRCQAIEATLREDGAMTDGYLSYGNQNTKEGFQLLARLKPSHAVALIYCFGAAGWAIYTVLSYPVLVSGMWTAG